MKREWLKLPSHTTFALGACVGRYCSAVIVATTPEHPLLVVDEIPNYHYVGDGDIELNGMTTVEWGETVVRNWRRYTDDSCVAWVDSRTTFANDLKRCKLFLRRNSRDAELRTEITREYFQDKKIYLMPWLTLLPVEIQRAHWPPEESSQGYARATGQDYSLTALEHILSRRPQAQPKPSEPRSKYLAKYLQEYSWRTRPIDPHTGSH